LVAIVPVHICASYFPVPPVPACIRKLNMKKLVKTFLKHQSTDSACIKLLLTYLDQQAVFI
jgi:hypothetical protein